MHNGIYLDKLPKEKLLELAKLKCSFVILSHSADNDLSLVTEAFPDTDIYISYRCFEGRALLEKFPEAKAVDAHGKETVSEEYFPVSPINKNVRDYHLQEIEELSKLKIKGIWLDHFQFPTKWESPNPEILDTDFSESAIKKFENYIGEEIEGTTLKKSIAY